MVGTIDRTGTQPTTNRPSQPLGNRPNNPSNQSPNQSDRFERAASPTTPSNGAFDYSPSSITSSYNVRNVISEMAQSAREGRSIAGDLRAQIAEWSSSGDIRQYNARTQSGNVQQTALYARSPIGTVGSMRDYTAPQLENFNPTVQQIKIIANAIQYIGIDPAGTGFSSGGLSNEERQQLDSDPNVQADRETILTALQENPEAPQELLAIASIAKELTEQANQNIQAGNQLKTELRQATNNLQPKTGGSGGG